jgi:hypothetical protein
MNKTRKRAIQKHRAKAIKYEVRRKSEGDSNPSRQKVLTPAASSPARPKAPTRRREATEAEE